GCLAPSSDTLLMSYRGAIAPSGTRPTEPPEAIHAALVLAFVPLRARALAGFGGVTGKCARLMSASGKVPFDLWQSAHCASSGSGPAGCAMPVPLMSDTFLPAALSLSVTPVPVLKLMPSWQEPHASMLGTFSQLSPSLVLVESLLVLEASWHDVQLRMSCGYVVSAGRTPA